MFVGLEGEPIAAASLGQVQGGTGQVSKLQCIGGNLYSVQCSQYNFSLEQCIAVQYSAVQCPGVPGNPRVWRGDSGSEGAEAGHAPGGPQGLVHSQKDCQVSWTQSAFEMFLFAH